MQRRKGAAGELEVCKLLHEHGWTDATRSSDGKGQAGRGDVRDGPAGVHLEVRRRETASLWAWAEQATIEAAEGCIPVVACRRSRSPWLAVVPLDELLALLAHRERG